MSVQKYVPPLSTHASYEEGEKTMDITVNWERYAKKVLKNLEKDLKNAKSDWEKEYLEKEIVRHKENYAEYLK